jgi:hypothetical protein
MSICISMLKKELFPSNRSVSHNVIWSVAYKWQVFRDNLHMWMKKKMRKRPFLLEYLSNK